MKFLQTPFILLTVTLVTTGFSMAQTPEQSTVQPQPHGARVTHLPGLPVERQNAEPPVTETRIVDLSRTISTFAKATNTPIEKARAEAIHFIGMSPLNPERRARFSRPTFEMLGNDQFSITATSEFFERLNPICKCLEAGKKQILIDCKIFQVTPTQLRFVNEILETAQGTPPEIDAAPPVSVGPANKLQYSRSSTIVRELNPCVTRVVPIARTRKLHEFIQKSKCNRIHSPRVITYPEQQARVEDTSMHPFVVNARKVGQKTWQPEIEFLKNGIVFEHSPSLEPNGNILLKSKITNMQVLDVQTVNYQAGSDDLRLQAPKQKQETVELSLSISDGAGILIDPNFRKPQASNKHSSAKKESLKTLYFISVKTLPIDGEPNSAVKRN